MGTAVLSLVSAAALAQESRLNVRVGGDDFRGTSVSTERFKPQETAKPADGGSLSGGPSGPNPATATDSRTVEIGGSGGRPLEPGLHRVSIHKSGGPLLGAETFVFVGPGQSKTVELSLDGVPTEGWGDLLDRARGARERCQLQVYDDAMSKLRLVQTYYEHRLRDLKQAIGEFLDSSLVDGVPPDAKANVANLLNSTDNPGPYGLSEAFRKNLDWAREGARGPGMEQFAALEHALFTYGLLQQYYIVLTREIEKLLPRPECGKRTAMLQEATRPLTVGAKDAVGCTAKLRESVTEQVGGLLGGMLGRATPFGAGPGGGGGGGGGPDLSAEEDPVKKDAKREYVSPDGKVKTAIGTLFTDQGLWVSANVLDAPCKGTFQTIYLQDPETGRKAGPTQYLITDLYLDWKLTVSWTRDTYVDGKHVKHESGGWSDSGTQFLGSWSEPGEGQGIWKNLGFSTAVAGASGVAAFFPIDPEVFARKPLDVVIHVSRPDLDPVITSAFGFESYVPTIRLPEAPPAPAASPQPPAPQPMTREQIRNRSLMLLPF